MRELEHLEMNYLPQSEHCPDNYLYYLLLLVMIVVIFVVVDVVVGTVVLLLLLSSWYHLYKDFRIIPAGI